MGDFDYGALGGGLKGSAGVLEGLRLGKADQEEAANRRFEQEIKKQQTFNQVAQLAIESAKLKIQLNQLDPDYDTSKVDQVRMMISGAGQQLGADEINAQAATSQPGAHINMLGQGPSISPQYNPMGVDLTGFKPLTEREKLNLQARSRTSDGSAAENQLRMFELRDLASGLKQSRNRINQSLIQGGAQEFQSMNTWGSTRTYDKLRGTKNAHIADLMEEYKSKLYEAFESGDQAEIGVAKRENPTLYKQWLKEKEYESSPEKKIEEYQNAPQGQPGGEEVVEPGPTPEQSARIEKLKELGVAYLQGKKIPEIPTDGYSEQAFQDALMKYSKKGLITPAQVSEVMRHLRSIDKKYQKDLVERRLFDDNHAMLSKEERDMRWARRQQGAQQAKR